MVVWWWSNGFSDSAENQVTGWRENAVKSFQKRATPVAGGPLRYLAWEVKASHLSPKLCPQRLFIEVSASSVASSPEVLAGWGHLSAGVDKCTEPFSLTPAGTLKIGKYALVFPHKNMLYCKIICWFSVLQLETIRCSPHAEKRGWLFTKAKMSRNRLTHLLAPVDLLRLPQPNMCRIYARDPPPSQEELTIFSYLKYTPDVNHIYNQQYETSKAKITMFLYFCLTLSQVISVKGCV